MVYSRRFDRFLECVIAEYKRAYGVTLRKGISPTGMRMLEVPMSDGKNVAYYYATINTLMRYRIPVKDVVKYIHNAAETSKKVRSFISQPAYA